MSILARICTANEFTFKQATPLQGGDINTVYLVSTVQGEFVVKLNSATRYPQMFQKEANGLNELRKAKNTFYIPEVIFLGEIDQTAYLAIEYLPTTVSQDERLFGEKLAALHQTSQRDFGFFEDNYIGSLPQKNQNEPTAASFYVNQRLQPLFQIALDKGYNFPYLEIFYKQVLQLIPPEKPSLIHGDLWNGNYLSTNVGFALIDPAVSYSIREMDIAMMKLFGGFSEKVFQTYHDIFPMLPNWQDRIKLYQLYYLLVHLLLFGRSYYHRVKQIVNAYV